MNIKYKIFFHSNAIRFFFSENVKKVGDEVIKKTNSDRNFNISFLKFESLS